MKEIKIRGRDVKVELNEHSGVFSAEYAGQDYESSTLAGLKTMLEQALKRKPISVPCIVMRDCYWQGGVSYTKGTITGVHSTNGDYLIRWEDGRTGQLPKYDRSILRADAKVKEIEAARKLVEDAEKRYKVTRDKYKLPEGAVQKLLDAAASQDAREPSS